MMVQDEEGVRIGNVSDVLPTGGADILVVRRSGEQRDEVMIPLARDIVIDVDEGDNRIIVRLPEGLLDINR